MPIGRRFLVIFSVLGAALALSMSTAPAGAPDDTPGPDIDLVIMVGTYSCYSTYYGVLDEPPITLLSHRMSFSGTGLLVPPVPAGGGFGKVRGVGPGIRPPVGAPRIPGSVANHLGLSTSVDLGEGTGDECIPLAESIAGAATAHGCVSSPVRSNPVPYYQNSTTFTVICEGPAAEQLRTIGDLSRAIITAELP